MEQISRQEILKEIYRWYFEDSHLMASVNFYMVLGKDKIPRQAAEFVKKWNKDKTMNFNIIAIPQLYKWYFEDNNLTKREEVWDSWLKQIARNFLIRYRIE